MPSTAEAAHQLATPAPYATSLCWLDMLRAVYNDGQVHAPRGLVTKELLGYQTKIPMSHPVMGVQERNLGYKFMAAEAAWILSGDNRVATIAPYSKQISRFSDDGEFFFGAYGPKIRDQLPYVVSKFKEDVNTRHALINIWREQPRNTKDVPCTISLQWLIRNDELHCIDTMRSSDVWLGWPYDIFNMSMISIYLLNALRRQDPAFRTVALGNLYLNAASQHIYESQFEEIDMIVKDRSHFIVPSRHFLPSQFTSGEDQIDFLWAVANASKEHGRSMMLDYGAA